MKREEYISPIVEFTAVSDEDIIACSPSINLPWIGVGLEDEI